MVKLPARLVIGAPTSGGGKTTVATGLMSALRDRALQVAPFKVGQDFVDPGHHTLATGRPGRNLDPVLCGEDLIAPLFAHGSRGCDVALIEGVMGLFDGQLGTRGFSSTAHVAGLIQAPVLLVVMVTTTISVLKIFDLVLVIAPESLQQHANVLALEMWRASFGGARDFGLGSALAMLLLVMIIPAMIFNIRNFRRDG